jgi:hypothetical protein
LLLNSTSGVPAGGLVVYGDGAGSSVSVGDVGDVGAPYLRRPGDCDSSGDLSSVGLSVCSDDALTAGVAPTNGEGPLEEAFSRRRIRNQAMAAMMAMTATIPITIPAMAPPDRDESSPLSSGGGVVGVVAGSAVESGGVVPEVVRVVAVVVIDDEVVVLMIEGSSA